MTPKIHLLGPFKIPWLKAPRVVRVYAPPPTGHPPPVLFMFDGQNIFDDGPSFCGGWHLHDTASALAARGHTMPVIVGIDHGGPRRIDELSPFRCRMSRGQLPQLITWMRSTLMPRIQRDYPVRSDLASTAIGGASLGGLAALHAHHRHPELFGAALVMSPSLWLARGKIFRDLPKLGRPWTTRIYLDAGAGEPRMLRDAHKLSQLLRHRGHGDHDLLWHPDPHGRHGESSWRRRAPAALEFLFSPHHPAERAA